jgi:hypothetical protein
MSCPESRVCPLKGMVNITAQSDRCPDGYRCGINTTSASKFDDPCPAGYWCDYETKPSDMSCAGGQAVEASRAAIAPNMTSPSDPRCFSNPEDPYTAFLSRVERQDGKRCYCPIGLCPAGYLCYEGTKAETRKQTLCPEFYFCPEGTAPDMLPNQRCPEGTRSPQGSSQRRECIRMSSRPTAGISQELISVDVGESLEGRFSKYIVTDPAFNCRAWPDTPTCEGTAPTSNDDAATATAVSSRRALLARMMLNSSSWEAPSHTVIARLPNETWDEAVAPQRRILQSTDSEIDSTPSYLGSPPELTTFKLPAFKMARMTFDLQVACTSCPSSGKS